MNEQLKYAAIAALGLASIVLGAALFAAVVDDGGGDAFGEIFGAALGIALIGLGIGTSIASAATYLAKRQ